MKKDENGNETSDIDWEKTKAVAVRTSYIWINLKGRDEFGIVEPEDKYAVEEQIIDDLYRYRNANGDRIIAMAFHNKDAKVLGLDGPYTGDIVYMNREHFVTEHGQGLSTYEVADEYIGSYLHLLDKGWDIILTSDHGEQIHTEAPARLGSAGGVSAGIMKELG